jgi:putative membrane protein
VRSFAERMVVDHTKTNAELRTIAERKGVTLSTRWASDRQKSADELAKATGAAFDERYARLMVDDHERDVKEVEKASRDVKDPELRAWASRTLPILQEHLRLARGLEATTTSAAKAKR